MARLVSCLMVAVTAALVPCTPPTNVLDWDEHELGMKLTGSMFAVPIQLKRHKVKKVAYEHSLSGSAQVPCITHTTGH